MKTLVALAISILALVPARAQIFRPETVSGAVLGGVAGAVIGNNSGGHNAWKGAAIGTVAGALIGSAVADSRDDYDRRNQVPVPSDYSAGCYYSYSPGYYRARHYYDYDRPSYATRGLVLGGIAGAVIGNNSRGHNAWRGAAWGAGAGLLLGAIADESARRYDDRVVVVPSYESTPAPQQTQTAPQTTTIINNYYGNTATPMSSANSMFGR